MKMTAAATALLAALAGGCGLLDLATPLLERTVTVAVDHDPERGLRVSNTNGTVAAIAADRADTEITAVIRSPSQKRLEEAELTATRDEQGDLQVSLNWPEGRIEWREQCHLSIRTPGAAGVWLTTTNGSVNTVGLSGEADLQTTNGPVRAVDHTGPIVAKSSNGRIKIAASDNASTVEAHTSNGAIEIENAPARVDASTSNGPITISTSDASTGPIVARSSNGAVLVEAGRGLVGRMSVTNSNGELGIGPHMEAHVVRREKRRVELRFDETDTESRVSTTNGSVEVRRR